MIVVAYIEVPFNGQNLCQSNSMMKFGEAPENRGNVLPVQLSLIVDTLLVILGDPLTLHLDQMVRKIRDLGRKLVAREKKLN